VPRELTDVLRSNVMTRACRGCSAPIGKGKQLCEPCRLERRRVSHGVQRCAGCGKPISKKTSGVRCVKCKGESARVLLPCPRCGVDFWPWANTPAGRQPSHARKFCCKAPANPKPPPRARLTSEQARQRIIERSRRYYRANREHVIRVKLSYKRRKYASDERYREMARATVRRWSKKNSAVVKRIARDAAINRRARKRGAFRECVKRAEVLRRSSSVCGICLQPIDPSQTWHVDHIVPLSRGGEHSYANVQAAHPRCNERKGSSIQVRGQ